MVIEPPVFDRDDGVLKVLGNLRERNIVALLVEAEPRLTVGAVEDRIADSTCQPVDDDGVSRQPDGGNRSGDDQRDEKRERDPVEPAAWTENVQCCCLLSCTIE